MNITNFRELGGYETTSKKHVKHGLFYRSSAIIFQTEEDRNTFMNLHMKTILDLRSDMEAASAPDNTVENCRYIHCSAIPIDTKNAGNFDFSALIKSGKLHYLVHYIEEIYKQLPFDNEAYRTLFNLIRNDQTPLVFHCSAGKDRTGFAAYLILKTLGVPDETIMHDYMLSNIYRKEENEKLLAQIPPVAGTDELLYVKERYLQLSIDAIMEKYGDFETYVFKEYGVTEEEILMFRERYLD